MMHFSKKLNLVICLFLSSIFISCTKNRIVHKEFYEDGSIKSEIEKNDEDQLNGRYIKYYQNGDTLNISNWKNGIKEGMEKEFYKENKLKAIFYFSNGKLNGESLFFYESGNLETLIPFKDGLMYGIIVDYYDSPKKQIYKITDYINFHGKEKAQGWIEYNEDGTIKNQESRVIVIAEKDTVLLGDSITVEIELTAPKYDSTYFFIGDYDAEFFLKPSSKIDTIYSQKHKVIYKSKSNKKGVNFIRGGAKNYQVLPRKDMAKREIVRPEVYFEYEYFVQ